MNGLTDDWQPEVDWSTSAGNLLQSLFRAIPSTTETTITLFGSSPLQLAIDASFKSNDVDLFTEDDPQWLEKIVEAADFPRKPPHTTSNAAGRETSARDLYRPNFDEEVTCDITTNTAVIWPDIFGRPLDVRKEIIAPALERRRRGYLDDLPREDYNAEPRRLAEE